MAAPFHLDIPDDTVAFVIISTPDMFEKAFKPFITRQDCLSVRDPIDECVAHYFLLIKEVIF